MKEKIYHLGVKALIQNASGDILLLKGNSKEFQEAHWDIPGGRVVEEETIEETLFREVKEETGLKNFLFLEHVDTLISTIEIPLPEDEKAGLILTVYQCSLQEFPFITLSSEHSEYAWTRPEKASALLLHKYPKSFIEKVKALAPHYKKVG
jgi:8-oxo-dGTP pyrophosphatase MutT (NUDIX family)